jgi:pyruvate formate lyase activating enzyme
LSVTAHPEAETGLVFDVKHFAVHDGPGIRTTIFLKGCSLRCAWCHSPESQSPEPEVAFNPDPCIGCGHCVEACSNGAQTMGNPKILRERCNASGRCVEVCFAGALTMYGEKRTVGELLEEVERNRPLYETSGGGVTVSGGEPTIQPAFTRALLGALKDRGIHTALDTCGLADWEVLRDILEHVDLVLYDLKHMDSTLHESMTGLPNHLILSNLERVAGLGKTLVIRVPVIPGFNDDVYHFRKMGRFLEGLGGVESVELLPYHNLGSPKYATLGREYPLGDLESPGREALTALGGVLEARGLRVVIEGVE